MHKYTITTGITGTKRKVKVIVYERQQDLKGAVTKYGESTGDYSNVDKDLLAVCHNFSTIHIGKGTEIASPYTNIIRLSREHLTPRIIAHEFVHAAQHIYSLDYPDDTDPMHGANEEFAHLYGELFNAFWPMIHTQVRFKSTHTTKI